MSQENNGGKGNRNVIWLIAGPFGITTILKLLETAKDGQYRDDLLNALGILMKKGGGGPPPNGPGGAEIIPFPGKDGGGDSAALEALPLPFILTILAGLAVLALAVSSRSNSRLARV